MTPTDPRVASLADPDPGAALEAARELGRRRRAGEDMGPVLAALRRWLDGAADEVDRVARSAHALLTPDEALGWLEAFAPVLGHPDPPTRGAALSALAEVLGVADPDAARTLWEEVLLPRVSRALDHPACWARAGGLLELAARRGYPLAALPGRLLESGRPGSLAHERALWIVREAAHKGGDVSSAFGPLSRLSKRRPDDRLVSEALVRGRAALEGWSAIEALREHPSPAVVADVRVVGEELVTAGMADARARVDKQAMKTWMLRSRMLRS